MRFGRFFLWVPCAVACGVGLPVFAQTPAPGTPQPAASTGMPDAAQSKTKQPPASAVTFGQPVQASSLRAERKAAKLYLEGVQLLEKDRPAEAWERMKQAAALTPGNATYLRAAELARQSTVAQLVQQASRQREQELSREAAGAAPAAIDRQSALSSAELLQKALAIDPENPMVLEHLNQLAGATAGVNIGATSSAAPRLVEAAMPDRIEDQNTLSDGPIVLEPKPEKHSFHTRATERQIVQQVFRAYGIEATVSEAGPGGQAAMNKQVRLDLDDATFSQAAQIVGLVTRSFYEPLDPHRVLVADDTRENRAQFQRELTETVYLGGMNDAELKEVNDIARSVFNAQQATTQPSMGTLTLRAPAETMAAFNQTLAQLEQGRGQVDLNVKVIQLAHIADRETGATLFQQTGVYNAYSEIQSIINSNQSAVQQIISQGLVPNDTTLNNQITIIGILLAAGQLSGSIFNNGLLTFGNGISASLLSVSPATLTMSLNSSDTRMLDDIHLQLADDEDGTFKIGERYPIETSQYSSAALPSIPGLSTSVAAAASQVVPQVQYEDIGLTLKARPRILRGGDVALTLDLKITALGGSSINSIPILNSQQDQGVITLKAGETAVLAGDLSSTESRALSGLPGIGDIPGLEDFNDIQKNHNVSRILILVTPRVVRNVQNQANSRMLLVNKSNSPHIF